MVELVQLVPRIRCVTRVAPSAIAPRERHRHTGCEPVPMRVFVAYRAGLIIKPEFHGSRPCLMAFPTDRFGMASGEREPGALVLCVCESRRLESALIMAGFTTIFVRLPFELRLVDVAMARDT